MKKIFTLALTALVALGAQAQTGLRKSWDFREGFSQKTINALAADQEEFGPDKYWRNYESDASKASNGSFWNASPSFKNSDNQACTHAGGKDRVIPELEGLTFTSSTKAKKIVINYNYSQGTNEGSPNGQFPYGKSFLWINGAKETFTFVANLGQEIRIGVESHSNAQNRGISLATSNGTLTQVEGNPTPVFFNEVLWTLDGDPSETATLTVTSTNGCHVYYIIVGDGVNPTVEKPSVAYLTSGDAASEKAWQLISDTDEYDLTAVDAATITADELQKYVVTVVSCALDAASPAVQALKEALPYTPVINLNSALYGAWGYGEAAAGSMALGLVNNLKSELLAGLSTDEGSLIPVDDTTVGIALSAGESFNGVVLGDYFAGDDIVVSDPSNEAVAAIHVHNALHNAYVYLPFTADASSELATVFTNAVGLAQSSKSEVEPVSAPKITLDYKDQNTNIILAMASSNLPKPQIFYTLDGSDPTEESTPYTEPVNVTSPCTVKAVALAEGYKLSEVASAEVAIYSQPAAPTLALDYQDGVTKVTVSSETPDVKLWYNYTATNDTTKSMPYTEPVEIAAPTDFTAFAVAGEKVFSELTTQRVVVKDAIVRRDVIGGFDPAQDGWLTAWNPAQTGSTAYYFTWGKNAITMYDDSGEYEIVQTENGDSIVYPERDYQYAIAKTTGENGEEILADWEVKSKGQVMIYQVISVGSDPGNGSGYNPETAGDILSYAKVTKNDIQFAGKQSGESPNGVIQSRVTFQAPFDIVAILGAAAANSGARMQLEVSTDSVAWTPVGGEMTVSNTQRLWKSFTRSYNGTDNVYVRIRQAGGGAGAQVYNLYILNEGENSKELKEQYDQEFADNANGVTEVKAATILPAGIYSLGGNRLSSLQRGLNIVVMANGNVKKVLVK